MNHTLVAPAEVRDFVEQVRQQLRDLPDDVRDDLTDGLEADLAERVSEHGLDLGDPALYAAELRAAAGLEQTRSRRRLRRPSVSGVDALLDRAHERWDRVLAAVPGGAAGFVETLRPVWWVIRGWLAVELVDVWHGGYPFGWVPSLLGPVGWVLTMVAVVVSVQLGRGVLPLGPLRGTGRRVVLLGLNVLAIGALVPVVNQLPSARDVINAYGSTYVPDHLAFNGNQVLNVYPYDAAGQPLTGVQLIDQNGRRLSVAGGPCQDFWTNGNKRVYSAFPVPSRSQNPDTARCTGPTGIEFPLASLPPVTLPASMAAAAVGSSPS